MGAGGLGESGESVFPSAALALALAGGPGFAGGNPDNPFYSTRQAGQAGQFLGGVVAFHGRTPAKRQRQALSMLFNVLDIDRLPF